MWMWNSQSVLYSLHQLRKPHSHPVYKVRLRVIEDVNQNAYLFVSSQNNFLVPLSNQSVVIWYRNFSRRWKLWKPDQQVCFSVKTAKKTPVVLKPGPKGLILYITSRQNIYQATRENLFLQTGSEHAFRTWFKTSTFLDLKLENVGGLLWVFQMSRTIKVL